MSKGAKHTLSDTLVGLMARQLGFGTSANFVNFVGCTLIRTSASPSFVDASGSMRRPQRKRVKQKSGQGCKS